MTTAQTRPAERHRPLFHFTPARHWLNDPNGLLHFGGEYHLFFQHNPFGSTHGHMSWGHAVSRDLLAWEDLGVALPEREGRAIFSGSAVVDWHNTSGLGLPDVPPLVALYTGHREGHQAQYLAYSRDRGRTWHDLGEVPVLDRGKCDFRDPKVFWHSGTERWVMAVAHPTERQVEIFRSPSLRDWTSESLFGPAGDTSGPWEVPELFPLMDEDGLERWVLKVDVYPGRPAGGSGCQYFVGTFDGRTFSPTTPARWLDHGPDFYAALSFSDLPGRRVWLGWMNNWRYASRLPTEPWRGTVSVPRELSLAESAEGPVLRQQPVAELDRPQGAEFGVREHTLRDGVPLILTPHALPALDLSLDLAGRGARRLVLHIGSGDQEEVVISCDLGGRRLVLRRTTAPSVGAPEGFDGEYEAPLTAADHLLSLRILVDRSSVEVFAQDGRVVMTALAFPEEAGWTVRAAVQGGDAEVLRSSVYALRRAAPPRPGSGDP